MKIVVALCLLASSTAFVPRSLGARPVVRVRADVVEEPATTADDPAKLLEQAAKLRAEVAEIEASMPTPAPRPATTTAASPAPAPRAAPLPTNSQALPFAPRPPLLDGTLAGDAGFDPLGLADTRDKLAFMADAEVKHARLAMLCAAGWPLSELLHATLAGRDDALLAAGGRAPSILNGGLFDTPAGLIGLALLLGGGAAVELASGAPPKFEMKSARARGKEAGEIGFDPLGLYGETPEARLTMRTKELKNGRAAMVAVLAYVGAEAVTAKPVVALTPALFKPIWVVLAGAVAATAPEVAAPLTQTLASAAPIAELAAPAVAEVVAAAPVAEAVAAAAPVAEAAVAAAAQPVAEAAVEAVVAAPAAELTAAAIEL